jgi:hypothetical protein
MKTQLQKIKMAVLGLMLSIGVKAQTTADLQNLTSKCVGVCYDFMNSINVHSFYCYIKRMALVKHFDIIP